MNIIVTGKIIQNRKIIGYRYWIVNSRIFRPMTVLRENVKELFSENVLNCKYSKYSGSLSSRIGIPMSDYPVYDIHSRRSKKSKYTDSDIIAASLNMSVDSIRIIVCGALVYGAINPDTERASRHADLYYEEIRHMSNDVVKIAKRTGRDVRDIIRVKNYLFMEVHDLGGEVKRFDSSFEIAQSWQRLMTDGMEIQEHDIILLEHEIMEMALVNGGMDQDTAHTITSKSFDYGKGAIEYYDKINKHK